MNYRWKLFLAESEERKGTYSFDFDNTLTVLAWDEMEGDFVYKHPRAEMIERLRELASKGNNIIIVTSRNHPDTFKDPRQLAWQNEFSSPEQLVADLNLPVSKIFYTNGQPKIYTLAEQGVVKHYDDDEREMGYINQYNRKHPESQIEFELVQ